MMFCKLLNTSILMRLLFDYDAVMKVLHMLLRY